MSQLRALLPLPTVLPIEGGSPDPACSSLPCAAMNVSGMDLLEIQSSTMASEADAGPPEREQEGTC